MLAAAPSDALPLWSMPLNVIHRDERILVLNKPTGLLSVPGIGPDKQDCLAVRAAAEFPGARIVHRLDRDTSGVIIMAFDAEAHRELSRQFHDREVRKRYIAIVAGLVEDEAGEINLPMRKDMDPANAPRQVIDHEQGRSAVTRYRVLERGPVNSLSPHHLTPSPQEEGEAERDALMTTRLELQPITGRSHQLRLHLKCIGHPILGDDLYAPPEAEQMADRLLLHAEALWVAHPGTAEPMTFEAPCPF